MAQQDKFKIMKEDAFLKKLGKNIARIRKEKGYSQDRLYIESELARRTIDRLETGKVDPRATTLLKISKTLKVPLTELVDIK